MAKKKGFRGGKDKGKGTYHQRGGMGRLRRAHAKKPGRIGSLERHVDDDDYLGTVAEGSQRTSHTGESLLMKFNRLARDLGESNGVEAEVCGFDGAAVVARLEDGTEEPCQMRRVIKKMLSGVTNPLVVGDRVAIERTPEGDPVIAGVTTRHNQLARAGSHNKALEHVFAANVDYLVIVAALAQPELKTGLIDRYLVIAHHNDIEPVIVFNKTDLADPGPATELYQSLGYQTFGISCEKPDANIDALRAALTGRTCVFTGQSGVGKSSLVNALYPELAARTGNVSDALNKGRHTTTSSRSYAIADGGRLIDTPGIRECGITGLTSLDVALLYRDIAELHHNCRFSDCSHRHEPDCAVIEAVEEGRLAPTRYLSYLSILDEDLHA